MVELELIDPITPEMVKAGIDELRAFRLGGDMSDIVKAIYMAMEYERRDQIVEPPRPLKTLSPEELEPSVGAVLKVEEPMPQHPPVYDYRWRRDEATYRED